ncbi:MAG: AMP-binding protein [Pseudomonadales bacterium]
MSWSKLLSPTGDTALSDGVHSLDFSELMAAVRARAEWLTEQAPQCVGLDLDNGIEWVVFDLACAEAGIPCVPIPRFFSATQRAHTLMSSGVELIVCDAQCGDGKSTPFNNIACVSQRRQPVALPHCTAKITFTSGSTGRPKGVCLSTAQQLASAKAVNKALHLSKPVHLCLLSLSTLLENIAGVYAPLLSQGTVYVPNSESLGFSGSRLSVPEKLLRCITDFKPDTLILVPELLRVLIDASLSGWRAPKSLQFVAVGGARVAPAMLEQAWACGLPVYQGYGLSECGSVVCLNTPDDNRTGAIGRPLSQIQTELRDGELVLSGNTFLGYLGDPASWNQSQVLTGDLVSQDTDGMLWFHGRIRNQIVSSFGRNISPEWPESELLSDGSFSQAVVLGNDRPYCVAIVMPANPLGELDIANALNRVNARLPDYAQVKQCLVLDTPMSSSNQLFTANGRPNRCAINGAFSSHIESLYARPVMVCSFLQTQDKENAQTFSPPCRSDITIQAYETAL